MLIVNLNPGGPNEGSATQYFIGDFNGSEFTAAGTKTHWLDYGPDEYAGITWSNTGTRKIFLGWMSNRLYANEVPTVKWRNAMTIPRELTLKKVDGEILLSSAPVKEIYDIAPKTLRAGAGLWGGKNISGMPPQYILKFSVARITDYAIVLSNTAGEKLIIGYDHAQKRYYIDRQKSGKVDFNKDFAKTAYAPRLTNAPSSSVTAVVDASSVEVFADGGLTVMTGIFFPSTPYSRLQIQKGRRGGISNLKVLPLSSVWGMGHRAGKRR